MTGSTRDAKIFVIIHVCSAGCVLWLSLLRTVKYCITDLSNIAEGIVGVFRQNKKVNFRGSVTAYISVKRCKQP